MRSWTELILSPTSDIYEKWWTQLLELYDNNVPELVSYLQDTWLTFWKQLLVHAYIDHYPHFGNCITS